MHLIIHDGVAETSDHADYAVRAGYATQAATALYADEAGLAANADSATVADHTVLATTAIWSICCDNAPETTTIKRNAQYRAWYGTGGLMPVDRIEFPVYNGSNSSYSYLNKLTYTWSGGTTGDYFTRCSVTADVTVSDDSVPWERVNVTAMTGNETAPYRAAAVAKDNTHLNGALNEEAGYEAYKCFDKNSGTKWRNVSTIVGHMIGIDFGSDKTVDMMAVTPSGEIAGAYVDMMPVQINHNGSEFFGTNLGIGTEEATGSFGARIYKEDWLDPKIKQFTFTNSITAQSFGIVMLFSQEQLTQSFGIKEIKLYKKKTGSSSSDTTTIWKYTFSPATGSSFTYPTLIGDIAVLKTQTFYIYSVGQLQVSSGTKLYYYSGFLNDGSPLITSSTYRYGTGDFYWTSNAGEEVAQEDVPAEVLARIMQETNIEKEYEQYIINFTNNIKNDGILNKNLMESHSANCLPIQSSSKYNRIGNSCRIWVDEFNKDCIWLINGIELKCNKEFFDITAKKPCKFKVSALNIKGEKIYKDLEIYFI